MSEDVIFSQEGQLGIITLNRPAALNALSLAMIHAMQQQLSVWKTDDSVQAVVVKAVPGTAFCAGGDVRWLYQTGKERDPQQMEFFWHEYRLNHFIHHFGKPYIALMDGMTMGGGVGVSLHGSHPIASERFVFAMPETSIGFFPDIGASHLLNACPGNLGLYVGLTGNRLNCDEAKNAGLVKHIVYSENMPELLTDLINRDLSGNSFAQVDACISSFAESSKPLSIELDELLHHHFAHATVEQIIDSLEESSDEWAQKIRKTLLQKSPLALKVTLAQLKKTQGLSLAECLKIDYVLVNHFMGDHDFYEGVRALLIDKDKNPLWNPADLAAVSETKVISYFETMGSELEL